MCNKFLVVLSTAVMAVLQNLAHRCIADNAEPTEWNLLVEPVFVARSDVAENAEGSLHWHATPVQP